MVGEQSHESYGTIPPSLSEPRDGEDGPDALTTEPDAEAVFDAGECPWCDEYGGEWPTRHARKAHPDEWEDYFDGE